MSVTSNSRAYTRNGKPHSKLFGTSGPATITGKNLVKAGPGVVSRITGFYTGSSASVFVQIFDAADAASAASAKLIEVAIAEVGDASSAPVRAFYFEPNIDIPFTDGLVIAFSSTGGTYTAAAAEEGLFTVWGA